MEGMCSGSGDCEVFNYPQSRSTERSTELTPKVSVAALIFALHGCPLSFKGDERSGGVSFFSEGATSSRALTSRLRETRSTKIACKPITKVCTLFQFTICCYCLLMIS